MADALRKANRAIHDRTLTEVDKQGMGTTASVLLLSGTRYLIGQVGDSRVYLLRDGALQQLTKDHSYVQEQVDAGFLTPEQARYHPYSNVITRCVGASPRRRARHLPGRGAASATCSSSPATDSRAWSTTAGSRSCSCSRAEPERKVHSLISEANGRGGLDNITAIIVQVARDGPGSGRSRTARGDATAVG